MDRPTNHKHIIYQMLPRLFGNANTTNKVYGSVNENGVGKFNDIGHKALTEIKAMGFTHVWYTGVIEHATMTTYPEHGIKPDDPDVVKGLAGSPYAIKDYYDVVPDLAVDIASRMNQFEALVKRTHDNGLKVLIDFVPNHVSRCYNSDVKPEGTRDFGSHDDKTRAFNPNNDFYYTPGKAFVVPPGYNPGGDGYKSALKDGFFDENPAKATGNDVFSNTPSIDDWFETVKLNYGTDYLDGSKPYFDPVPPVWNKMFNILHFWSAKGVDGFRCDMVEMVPVEFWSWVIPKIKETDPHLIFIGEAYNTQKYHDYIFKGHFDYLYDKVGLYDGLKRLIRDEPNGTIWDINKVCFHESAGFPEHMLRFLENHDEERIAAPGFAGNPWYAWPGMIVSATLYTGPVLIYSGQEVGEKGEGIRGFGGDNGRTSIFDYGGMPEHQKWLNNGAFDGGLLADWQKQLRSFYSRLLNIAANSDAIKYGKFYELMLANLNTDSGIDARSYVYLRYTDTERILILVNFNRYERNFKIKFPPDVINEIKLASNLTFTDLLTDKTYNTANIINGLEITIWPTSGAILKF